MLLRRVSLFAVLLLSLSNGAAVAQTPSQAAPRGVPNTSESVQRPNLNSDQVRKIGEVQKQYRDQIAQRIQQLRQAQQELDALLSGAASEREVRQKYRQVSTLRQQVEDLRFESTLAVRAVLTPQQRRQFADYLQQQRENYRNRTNTSRTDSGH
ncbi:MAG TPA: Spy/CpxP family protein refolding chaperone [Allocoleopsis sp.]